MSNKYTLPALGYAFDALEPYVDAATMELHHDKHHAAYVNNANAVFEKHPELFKDCPACFCRSVKDLPADVKTALRNNVGGHYNHTLFWESLKKDVALPAALEAKLVENFGSVDAFKAEFEKAAATRFGSGWAWLVLTADDKLKVVSTANQDNPLMGVEVAGVEGTPLLALDVWEHAYYLKYQNRRPEYVAAFWNVVNWDVVLDRLNKKSADCKEGLR
ncbi:superoxide dismutase [Mn] [Psittacicella melopsittaci]|uniref:Superoxide dismutase n=1 Tax=Psittacicella melopsittaci TaxID=2028576 RepID=A0A3A1Y4X7_9GAMM|nr:Fe-Mn family superoxide dismutase [Psittacicella melopsittaci]RIY31217.1 superoxide dismutase [Mn] [Psittacicella melopsittaci]